ncbi:FixH family protein [Bacillus sp. BRMEA1]|uniref:FixH family protein n=1 Tax=Neobacillus endophyticus TaxID=2738405 RepID=UPI0015677AB6|nr:FixH family protein [Neobacillus endophyticus]NRD80439.1 FixH family protein [Neobacillus endophyticus]
MRKGISLIMMFFLLVTAAACSSQEERANDMPQMVNVELSVKPQQIKSNQPVTFEAKITQGKEKVNDADSVVFEIWRAKSATHEKVEIKNPKNGVYSLVKTFPQEGTYYIISHVTARNMHNMPKKEFFVGTPSEPEKSTSGNSMEGMDMGEQQKPNDKNH